LRSAIGQLILRLRHPDPEGPPAATARHKHHSSVGNKRDQQVPPHLAVAAHSSANSKQGFRSIENNRNCNANLPLQLVVNLTKDSLKSVQAQLVLPLVIMANHLVHSVATAVAEPSTIDHSLDNTNCTAHNTPNIAVHRSQQHFVNHNNRRISHRVVDELPGSARSFPCQVFTLIKLKRG
jgi:hypothetical protein